MMKGQVERFFFVETVDKVKDRAMVLLKSEIWKWPRRAQVYICHKGNIY